MTKTLNARVVLATLLALLTVFMLFATGCSMSAEEINEKNYTTNRYLSIKNILVINENLDICFSILPDKHVKPNITKEELYQRMLKKD